MPTFEEIKSKILPFVNKYGIRRVGIFGSFARGDAKESSDIDLIFDFEKEFGLFALSGLKLALEDELGKKIDMVEFSSLDPYISKNIMDEVIMIYEQG
jgi:predicted nucleotidyltransferase